jgi:hypothetical protein
VEGEGPWRIGEELGSVLGLGSRIAWKVVAPGPEGGQPGLWGIRSLGHSLG